MAEVETTKKAAKTKKGAASFLGVLVGIAVVAGAFFLGARYFTAKRSTVVTVCAVSVSGEEITAYKLPSGVLDVFAVDGETSPFVRIPLATRVTVRDPQNKKTGLHSLSILPESPGIATLTINPKGSVCKIEMRGVFLAEGEATVKDKRELKIDKESYFVGGTLVLVSGEPTGLSGDDLGEAVETGDVLRLLGYGDQVLVLDVVERAGRVSVSSNVDGARVFVDGSYRGKTPCVFAVAPGNREVSVRAEGYVDLGVPVTVGSETESQVVADLRETTGAVNVSSTPSGAGVYAAGEFKGETPLKLLLTPGSWDIRVELGGYYPKAYKTTVIQDMEQSIAPTLTRRPVSDGEVGFGGQTGDGIGGGTGAGTGGGPSQQYRFTMKGRVLARNGDVLYIGDRWTECVVAEDVRVQDSSGDIPAGRVQPGDTVSVFGDSASSLRLVNVESSLARSWVIEGNLVRSGQGYKVFGDDQVQRIGIPGELEVIDTANRSKDQVGTVPQGSRVRFHVDSSGEAVWAEYVWRAGASVEGTLGALCGAVVRVIPSWEDLFVTLGTTVFLEEQRTSFFDLTVGDSVVAAGPFAKDIRFIWIRARMRPAKEVEAVTLSQSAKEGKVLHEYRGSPLGGYPIYAGSSVTLADPLTRRTIPANDLQYGDRVRLYVDEDRQITFGEVILRDDSRTAGVFLGERAGYYYFTGFVRYMPSYDLIVMGLGPGEDLEPGSRVLAASASGAVNYIEVQSEVKVRSRVVGTVLSSKDVLWLRGDWGSASYPMSKDAWFADWELRQDGPLSGLFPGDEVAVTIGLGRDAVFAERLYTAPFKLEGTIETISERTLIIADKTTKKAVTLANPVTVIKDGEHAGVHSLVPGDKVKLAGPDKAHIEVVVAGK